MKTNTKSKIKFFTILMALTLLTNYSSFAQSQGPLNPSLTTEPSAACLSCPGTDWNNWANAELKDNQFASNTMMQNGYCFQSTCYFTRALTATKYHFNIPLNATLTGIEVQMMKKAGAINSISDTIIHLLFDNLSLGNNNSLIGLWSANDSLYTYGDSTNLWGYPWAPAMINDSSFGVEFHAKNMSSIQADAFIDWIGVKIYYSLPGGIGIINSSSNDNFNIRFDNNNFTLSTDFIDELLSPIITIYDLLGQVCFREELPVIHKGKSTKIIPVNKIANGICFVGLTCGSRHFIKKIAVNN